MNSTYCISLQPHLHKKHMEYGFPLRTLPQITVVNGYPEILLKKQILESKAKVLLSGSKFDPQIY